MQANHLARTLAIAVLLVGGLLGGCGDSAADDASAKVCAARDDIAKQVESLKGLTLTTATTDAIGTSLEAIKTDLSTISKARGDLSDERRDEVDAANSEFSTAVTDIAATIGRSTSVEAAAADVKQAFEQLAASYKTSFGEIDCS
jgi:hypothetical protein